MTGRFPALSSWQDAEATAADAVLSQVTMCGSEPTVRRLLEEVHGLVTILRRLLLVIAELAPAAPVRVWTTDDVPANLVVEFLAPPDYMKVVAAIDRWMVHQPGRASRRVVVDVFRRA